MQGSPHYNNKPVTIIDLQPAMVKVDTGTRERWVSRNGITDGEAATGSLTERAVRLILIGHLLLRSNTNQTRGC
jgi:hypothetical protein